MIEKRFYLDENGINDKEYEFSILSEDELVDRINELNDENKKLKLKNMLLKKELKRCRDWLNSDKNDYQLTLAFIKSKGYSLKDVLEYEKELEE